MVRIVNHSGKFMQQLTDNQLAGLNEMGEFCVDKMNYYCAVDTGRLKSKNRYEIVRNELMLVNDVENDKGTPYAIFNEFGTRKWVGQPFMKPAAINHTGELKSIMAKNLARGMG